MLIPELDLHKYRPTDPHFIQSEIESQIDRFMQPYLRHTKKYSQIRIVVGKGHNSKRLINGKNPLRYYTEKYLEQLGFNYRSAGYFDGQEGVIIVSLVD